MLSDGEGSPEPRGAESLPVPGVAGVGELRGVEPLRTRDLGGLGGLGGAAATPGSGGGVRGLRTTRCVSGRT